MREPACPKLPDGEQTDDPIAQIDSAAEAKCSGSHMHQHGAAPVRMHAASRIAPAVIAHRLITQPQAWHEAL